MNIKKKLLTTVAAVTIAVPLTIFSATSTKAETCTWYGNTMYCSDGWSGSTYGNTLYGSDGNSWSSYGNTLYGSDGWSGSFYGNTLYSWD